MSLFHIDRFGAEHQYKSGTYTREGQYAVHTGRDERGNAPKSLPEETSILEAHRRQRFMAGLLGDMDDALISIIQAEVGTVYRF